MRRQQRGRRTSVATYLAQGWREEKCTACGGSGMRPGSGLIYQCPANECPACTGHGSTWISPNGRRCAYPGGPWMTR